MRRRRGADDGFSLIEVIVALGLVTVVLLALLSSSLFAVRATVDGRQNQQAADYLNAALEAVRNLDFGGATMQTTDLGTDANIVTVGGVKKFDPGTGLETIAATATGTVTPHIQTSPTNNNGTYTIKRYVTVPSAAVVNPVNGMPSMRKVTVLVSWKTRNISHSRKSSTIMTLTRRGLPLPNFTWKYNGPATLVGTTPTFVKNPDNNVDYGFVLNNLGARDSWNLTASTSGWTFYLDTDRDGLWSGDSTVEPMLNPVSTGLIEPGAAPVYVVARRHIGDGESGTTSTVFTATSDAFSADPNALTLYSKTVTTSLTVTSGAVTPPTASPTPSATAVPTASPTPSPTCTPVTEPAVSSTGTVPTATTQNSYTLTTLNLFNSTAAGDSGTLATTRMGPASSELESRLCNWSTDLQTGYAGRYLAGSGDSASATAKTAEFQFQPASALQNDFRGSPVLTFYAQCVATGTPSVTVSLLSLSGTTYTALTSTAVPLSSCPTTGFQRYSAQLSSMPTFSIATTDMLVLRVTTSAAVRVGYGATTAKATFTIGMK